MGLVIVAEKFGIYTARKARRDVSFYHYHLRGGERFSEATKRHFYFWNATFSGTSE